MTPKETTHYHIRIEIEGNKKLIHLCFLKQEYGVSVQDTWMAWFDDNGSRCHGDTAEEAIVNLVDTNYQITNFREMWKASMDKVIASFRTPVIGYVMDEDQSDFIEIQLRLPGSDNGIFCVRKYHKGTDWYPFWDHERRKLYRVDDPQPNSPDLIEAIDNFVRLRVNNG